MEKDRKVKKYSVIALIVALLGLTVVYAAMSITLNINATARANKTGINIVFEKIGGVTPDKSRGVITSIDDPELKQSGTVLNLGDITFNGPGDYYQYSINIVNKGKSAATITSMETPFLTELALRYYNVSFRYEDGINVGVNDILRSNQSKKVIIRLSLKEMSDSEYEQMPDDLTLNLNNLTINFEKAESEIAGGSSTNEEMCESFSTKSFGSSCSYTDNDSSGGITVGDKVTCGTEGFYVIENPSGGTVKMLSEYNLNVFDSNSGTVDGVAFSQVYACATEGYQDERIRSNINDSDSNHLIQVTAQYNGSGNGSAGSTCSGSGCTQTFSIPYGLSVFYLSDNYWSVQSSDLGYWVDTYNTLNSNFTACSGNYCNTSYDVSYPIYVYDKNNSSTGDTSLLTSKVNSYVSNLNSQISGANASGRLISYEELVALGCDASNRTCASAPSWVSQTSYWTGSASDNRHIYVFDGEKFRYKDFEEPFYGIRPVIEISTSAIN